MSFLRSDQPHFLTEWERRTWIAVYAGALACPTPTGPNYHSVAQRACQWADDAVMSMRLREPEPEPEVPK